MSADPGGALDGRREAFCLALASGRTVTAAAKRARVARRTAHGWLANEPAVAARVRHYRRELFGRASSRLCALGGRAAGVLGKLLGDADPKVRLAAAKAVLDAVPRLLEATELEGRLVA